MLFVIYFPAFFPNSLKNNAGKYGLTLGISQAIRRNFPHPELLSLTSNTSLSETAPSQEP